MTAENLNNFAGRDFVTCAVGKERNKIKIMGDVKLADLDVKFFILDKI